jgi:hypothetical protein
LVFLLFNHIMVTLLVAVEVELEIIIQVVVLLDKVD